MSPVLKFPSTTSSVTGRHPRGHVSLQELYLLTRQLHVLQKAGVSLLASLQALQTQLPVGTLKQVLESVCHDLIEGRSVSQALAQHPQTFPPVFLGIIRSGEAAGMLVESLNQLTQLLEWEIEVRQRLREALQYPIIVLSTLCLALTVIATFVLPQFARMFQSFRIELPLQTRLLIGLSHLLSHHGWLIFLALAGMVCAWWAYLRTESGGLFWDQRKLRLPIVGTIIVQLAMARLARITAALHHSGLPILETLALVRESIGNRVFQAMLGRVRERVKGGVSLTQAMSQEPIVPPVVIQMVATGEETGRLSDLLHSIAEYYEQQAGYVLRRLMVSLEPILLLVVGLGVLLLATAVFVPMWDMVKLFKHGGG